MSTDKSITAKTNTPLRHRGKFGVLKIISLSVLGIVLLAVAVSFYYLYQNIFNAYANFGAIASYDVIARVEVIDKNIFKKTKEIKNLKLKITAIPTSIRNVFIYKEIATTTPSKTTKTK